MAKVKIDYEAWKVVVDGVPELKFLPTKIPDLIVEDFDFEGNSLGFFKINSDGDPEKYHPISVWIKILLSVLPVICFVIILYLSLYQEFGMLSALMIFFSSTLLCISIIFLREFTRYSRIRKNIIVKNQGTIENYNEFLQTVKRIRNNVSKI